MKKYYKKVSLKSRMINFLFHFTNSKKIFSDQEKTKRYIYKMSRKKENYNLPEKLGMFLENNKNMKVYSYNGNLQNPKKKVLLYVHGGSYIEEAISYQIKFSMKIAQKTNSTLIMPIYPLAPNGNYKIMYQYMNELYDGILDSCDCINFLGDSAGGGFILSYSMYLRNNKKKQPSNIIMLSPWLDISMSNKELLEYEKRDPISGLEGNIYAGKLWANGISNKNYLVSPIYGEFHDLGIISVITGDRDMLKPDCFLLSNKLSNLGIGHNYIEYKGQAHDFGAYPTKEGKMVVQDIVKIIKGEK